MLNIRKDDFFRCCRIFVDENPSSIGENRKVSTQPHSWSGPIRKKQIDHTPG